MREIREPLISNLENQGSWSSFSVSTDDCRALFDYWRLALMGSLGPSRRLPTAVVGYFFQQDFGPEPEPLSLGFVRRNLLQVLDRVALSDDERTVIDLYYGFQGLPLPFLSKLKPDIAGGRDESTLRSVRKAALVKIAAQLSPRPGSLSPLRRVVDPLLEPWFRCRSLTNASKVELVARGYVRAVSQCDGPYAAPTLIALDRWYENSGYADQDLQRPRREKKIRPNKNALNRAAALMEIALFEEVRILPQPGAGLNSRAAPDLVPVPPAAEPDAGTLAETVTHPDLISLLQEELSPTALMNAAAVLQDEALNGQDVAGQMALFLRCLRPRARFLSGLELERLVVSISYVAAIDGNPFLSLEWLGHQLDRVGITDRTFTVLVNTSEAASTGGYGKLAGRTDQLFLRLRDQWEIPTTQIGFVEHAEAEQQRLVARAFHAEQVAERQWADGDFSRAIESFRQSIEIATRSTRMAHKVLTDKSTFPTQELEGKNGLHGGDLTWPWLLAAILRITQPLAGLQRLVSSQNLIDGELKTYVQRSATFAARTLTDFTETFDDRRFRSWHDEITSETSRLANL